jgi:hypothetical protein
MREKLGTAAPAAKKPIAGPPRTDVLKRKR